jgi:hypothetical protein
MALRQHQMGLPFFLWIHYSIPNPVNRFFQKITGVIVRVDNFVIPDYKVKVDGAGAKTGE